MFRITTPSVVAAVLEDFEDVWKDVVQVTQDDIDKMIVKSEGAKRSNSRSVSRCLSVELEDAHVAAS
jgi:hypothetical protein